MKTGFKLQACQPLSKKKKKKKKKKKENKKNKEMLQCVTYAPEGPLY